MRSIAETQEAYQTQLEGLRAHPESEELAEDLVKAWTERDAVFYTTKLRQQAKAHEENVRGILMSGVPAAERS